MDSRRKLYKTELNDKKFSQRGEESNQESICIVRTRFRTIKHLANFTIELVVKVGVFDFIQCTFAEFQCHKSIKQNLELLIIQPFHQFNLIFENLEYFDNHQEVSSLLRTFVQIYISVFCNFITSIESIIQD